MRSKVIVLIGALGGVVCAGRAWGATGQGPGGPTQAVPVVTWQADAMAWRGQNGTTVTLDCPAGGRLEEVWGTFFYTDDSSVCTAAVHAGVIGAARGGRIVIEIRAGEPSYAGTTQHGVSSGAWRAWPGTFVITGGTPGATANGPPMIDWSDTPDSLGIGGPGPIHLACPAGGTEWSIWGTALYTDDSSICTAAAHAGVITLAQGGVVMIALRPGAASYAGTTRNGITSTKWNAWSGSFVVLAVP